MYWTKLSRFFLTMAAVCGVSTVYAETLTIPVYMTAANGQGQSIGTVTVSDGMCGVLITPDLHGLTPGIHGFHVHEKPDCGDKGMAAGGHLDPEHTEEHNGPYAHKGHLGDLPVLIVNQDGTANLPTSAPRFTVAMMRGHSLMIHAGGDNYSDQPKKLGGGGDRIACGIIK